MSSEEEQLMEEIRKLRAENAGLEVEIKFLEQIEKEIDAYGK